MAKAFDPYHVWLGIPPGHRPPTYYQLLGIAPDEQDRDVIQAACLRLSAYVRNFQTGKHADDANRILTELAEARSCLLDAAARARYDASLTPATPPPSLAPSPNRPAAARAPRPAPIMAAPVPSPPVIELDHLVMGDYHAPPARAVALPKPRKAARRVAPPSSLPTWILPLALGSLAVLVIAVVVLRSNAPDTRNVIDGQFVATTPPQPAGQPSWQPAPLPLPNNPPNFNPPTVNSARPPRTMARQPFNNPFPPPSYGSNPPMSPPGNMSSSPPGSMSSSPPVNRGLSPPPSPPRQVEKPAAPPAKFIPPVERKPVPTGASLASARRDVDTAFAKEFRTAKTPSQKMAAVRGLYDQSQSAEKLALRYAYLKECSDRAINMGDAGLAFEALEEMGRLFGVETGPLKVSALKVSLDKSRQSEQSYTVAMLALAARTRFSQSDPSLAEQFDALATAVGRKLDVFALSESRIRRNPGIGGLTGLGSPRPGLAASFYAGSDFEQEVVRRVDHQISFRFGSDSADPSLPAGRFSVRWAGWLTPPMSGKYLITATAGGSVRVKIGDQTPIDSLETMFLPGQQAKEIELVSMPYPITVEYVQRGLRGGIRLSWAIKKLSTEHTIPAEAFSHEPMIGE